MFILQFPSNNCLGSVPLRPGWNFRILVGPLPSCDSEANSRSLHAEHNSQRQLISELTYRRFANGEVPDTYNRILSARQHARSVPRIIGSRFSQMPSLELTMPFNVRSSDVTTPATGSVDVRMSHPGDLQPTCCSQRERHTQHRP